MRVADILCDGSLGGSSVEDCSDSVINHNGADIIYG